MRTLVGVVTFGNLSFTKLAIDSVINTTSHSVDIVAVIGKPGDGETRAWLKSKGITAIEHTENKGFPASLNDIYDYTWKQNGYDNLIIIGNDIIAYPGTIDALITTAESTNYEWICSREYSVKQLTQDYPETNRYFSGDNKVFSAFEERPWEAFTAYKTTPLCFDASGLSDVHNCNLFTRAAFEKTGYIDVNFFPAYFEDNDICLRAIKSNVTSCTVTSAFYFHFWSRTIHQGSGGSNNKFFSWNSNFYHTKWGGTPGQEKYSLPFNGKPYFLTDGLQLSNEINIFDRNLEPHIINYWKNKR